MIVATKCRRGPSAAITKRGAYWLACEPVKIRRAGGDGIGQSGADVTFSLELRHYRSGETRAMVKRDAWHQNGSYSGGGTTWIDASEILGAPTIEDVIVGLLATGGDAGPVYSHRQSAELTEALAKLGLPQTVAAPDEA